MSGLMIPKSPARNPYAELVLEIPLHGPEKRERTPERRERCRKQDFLVPDERSDDDLVPDHWGGTDLA